MNREQAIIENIKMRVKIRQEVTHNEGRFDGHSHTEDADAAYDVALHVIDNYDDPNEKVFSIRFPKFEELTEEQIQSMVKQATLTYGDVYVGYGTVSVQLQVPQANEFSTYLTSIEVEHDAIDMTVYPT